MNFNLKDIIINSKISPLVAIVGYHINSGKTEFERLYDVINRKELADITKYFGVLSFDFLKWVKKYNEITIFRSSFRATYVNVINVLLLFVSRSYNSSEDIRPVIRDFIIGFVDAIIHLYVEGETQSLSFDFLKELRKIDKNEIKQKLKKVMTRFDFEDNKLLELLETFEQRPSSVTIDRANISNNNEDMLATYSEVQNFDLVPVVTPQDMTSEIIKNANKKAIISLLFSSIKGCRSQSAAAYLYALEDGSLSELYAGDLNEKKIVYVLDAISAHLNVINEMLQSKEELKILDANIVQIVVEEVSEGKLLIGITTDKLDVYRVGYKLKVTKFIIKQFGF